MAPAMNLTNEEKRLFGQLFKQCDPESLGIVTGEVARTIFERSGLPPRVLGEIWQLADADNNGFLDQLGFSLALRLIGYAQNGKIPNLDLASNPGPLPVFDSKSRPDPASSGTSTGGVFGNNTGDSSTNNGGSNHNQQLLPQMSGVRVPSLSPTDRSRFASLFQKSAPAGYLDGEQARTIFMKARLPNETLGQIWALADTHNRGQLDQSEFVVAMHFIQCILNGSMNQLPRQLPPGLYEAAIGIRPPSTQPVMSPNMIAGRRNMSASPGQPAWVITPHDKSRFDQMFDSLDKQRKGVIGAPEVVPFMTRSKLPEDTLAQIWDLADLHNSGEFTKTEFAIAMYLVQQKLNGKELPSGLPLSIINSVNALGTTSNSNNTQQTSAATESIKPPQRAMSGSLNDLVSLNDVFSTPSPTPRPPSQQPAQPSSLKKQTTGDLHTFVPTSSFGQSLVKPAQKEQQAPAQMPSSSTAPISSPPVQSPQPDLMSEAPTSSGAVAGDSMELANLSNQVSSLTNQTVALSEERKKTESELSQLQAAKADIIQKLAVLRTSYDAEVKKVQETTAQLETTKKEYGQAAKDYSVVEASLNALRSQYETTSSQLVASRNQHQSIKDQIRAVNDEIASLKTTLEAAERESKQHSSVLAVSQSQLEVSQSERARLENELASVRAQNEEAARKIAEMEEEARRINEYNASIAAEVESCKASAGTIQQREVSSHEDMQARSAPSYGHRAQSPGNPFSQYTRNDSSFEEAFQSMSMGEAGQENTVNQDQQQRFETASRVPTDNMSQTQSHITETTLSSSPPTSEFPTGYNTADNQIPSFTLPIARPGSATSSVQNNPPQSVRGDIPSHPDSPADVTGEQVSGLVPPESLDLNASASGSETKEDEFEPENEQQAISVEQSEGAAETTKPENVEENDQIRGNALSLMSGALGGSVATLSPHSKELRESDGSYEFVDEHEGEANTIKDVTPVSAVTAGQAEPSMNETPAAEGAAVALTSNDEQETVPGAFPTQQQPKEEFPPIRELEQDEESSSDEEGPEPIEKAPMSARSADSQQKDSDVDKFLTPESTGVGQVGGSNVRAENATQASTQPIVPEIDETEFSFAVNPHSLAAENAAPVTVSQNAPMANTSASFNDADAFDSAFADLSEAQDEKYDIEQDDLNEFENAFNAMGSQQQPAPASGFGVSEPSVPGQGQVQDANAQPSNDEWEQLFAGFSGGPAGQQEINDAFQLRQPLTPKSEAVRELCGMGFSDADARDALEHTKYNLSEASNYLLDRRN